MTARPLLTAVLIAATIATPAIAQSAPQWKVDVTTSRMDGSPSIDLTMNARAPIDGWVGGFTPKLVVRCVEHALWVTVVTGLPAANTTAAEEAPVHYRLDDQARQNDAWTQLRSGDALVAPDAAAFLAKLLAAKRLRFEFTPANSSLMILEFPLTGLRSIVSKYPKACDWPT